MKRECNREDVNSADLVRRKAEKQIKFFWNLMNKSLKRIKWLYAYYDTSLMSILWYLINAKLGDIGAIGGSI